MTKRDFLFTSKEMICLHRYTEFTIIFGTVMFTNNNSSKLVFVHQSSCNQSSFVIDSSLLEFLIFLYLMHELYSAAYGKDPVFLTYISISVSCCGLYIIVSNRDCYVENSTN